MTTSWWEKEGLTAPCPNWRPSSRRCNCQLCRERRRQAVRDAKPGDRFIVDDPRLEVRPTFTGAGSPTFKPARHANRGPGK